MIASMTCVRLLLLWLVALSAGCGAPEDNTFAEPVEEPVDSEQQMLRRTIIHDGIEREFFVHVPHTTSSESLLPVVVALHGYTSTATGFAAHYGLNEHANRNGYIVVYPQGSHFPVLTPGAGSYRVTSWNDLAANQPQTAAGPHCTDDASPYPRPPECSEFGRCSWTSCYDDKGFIEQVLDVMQTEFMTDPTRYYLLGVSNGAMMALRMGCDMSERFAAVAPIIGQLAPGYACGPTTPLPLLHLYGAEDNTVRFDGQPGGDGFIYTTAAETTRIWADALACTEGPDDWSSEDSVAAGVTCSAYTQCGRPDDKVLSCEDADGRHEWPGQIVHGIPATCVTEEQYDSMPGQARCEAGDDRRMDGGMDLVWNFFRQYRSTETAADTPQ